jgi:hypothetical protein
MRGLAVVRTAENSTPFQAQGRKKGRRSGPAFFGSFAPHAGLMAPCVVDFRKPKELKQPDV